VPLNFNRTSHKSACITANQPDAESNPSANSASEQRAVVGLNVQLNIVTRPTYLENIIRDNGLHRFYYFLLSLYAPAFLPCTIFILFAVIGILFGTSDRFKGGRPPPVLVSEFVSVSRLFPRIKRTQFVVRICDKERRS